MAGTPVSGPGKMSRRTDTGPAQKIRDLPDAQYGEAATYKDLQQQAPLAQAPASPTPRPRGPKAPGAMPTANVPFGGPTERPQEPVTAGAALGPGPGTSAMGLAAPGVSQWVNARDMLAGLAQQNPHDTAVAYLMARLQGRY